MPIRRLAALIGILGLIAGGLSSCLARRRLITRTGAKTSQQLLVADRAFLLEAVTKEYSAIRSFSITVDMTPALGSAEKSRITEYKDVRAFILFQKPTDIRILGQYPVVRGTAFDMVSNGTDFKLSIPSRNRFIVGRNVLERPSENKLENLRPQHFLDALLVKPVDLSVSQVLLENFTDEDNAFYVIHEVRRNGQGQLQLSRTIWFSRIDLRLARQLIFDPDGNILTDARYAQWASFDGVPFPKHIEVNRPRDEYGVVIDIVKMDMNKEITPDKFVLNQPEGSTLQTVGQPPVAPPAAAAPVAAPPRKKR